MQSNTSSNSLKVVARNYTSNYHHISEHITIFQRTHLWPQNSREIDVFGRYWSLAWLHFPDDQVALHRLGEKNYLNGPLALFIPPFSVIDTEIKGGEIYWQAMISDLPLDDSFPSQATIYERAAHQPIPQSLEEIKKFFLDHQRSAGRSYVVEKVEIVSGVAENVRQFINKNFEEEFSISKISEILGYNHAVIDRAFKKAYGLSPINYRNKMRVLDSIHKLVLGKLNISDIGYDVGFSTPGNFAKQFKKIMKLPPSEFSGILRKRPSSNSHGDIYSGH